MAPDAVRGVRKLKPLTAFQNTVAIDILTSQPPGSVTEWRHATMLPRGIKGASGYGSGTITFSRHRNT